MSTWEYMPLVAEQYNEDRGLHRISSPSLSGGPERLHSSSDSGPAEVFRVLQELGAEGWELVAVEDERPSERKNGTLRVYWLKRPRAAEPGYAFVG